MVQSAFQGGKGLVQEPFASNGGKLAVEWHRAAASMLACCRLRRRPSVSYTIMSLLLLAAPCFDLGLLQDASPKGGAATKKK